MKLLLAILLGTSFLHVFYRAVRLNWPDSYVGAGDAGIYSLLASPLRYLAFRALPVYLACLFVAVSAARAGLDPWLASMGVAIAHGAATNGRVVLRDLRASRPTFRHRLPLLILRSGGLLLVLSAGIAAVYTVPTAEAVVPSLDQMSATLWTALLAGVVGGYIVNVTSGSSVTTEDLVAQSYATLDRSLFMLADDRAHAHGADTDLVKALMLVENIQRPGWIRRLEGVKGKIFPAGTYGVMQVRSERPLSNEESIDRAAARLAGTNVKTSVGNIDYDLVMAAANEYNPDPAYPELLLEALFFVQSRT